MRNPITEQILERHGADYSYAGKFELSKINRGQSLKNQARLDAPLDEETVNEYAQSMSDGAQFPAIVVYNDPKHGWVIIDGNHRHEAYTRNSVTQSDVYTVKTGDVELINRLTRSFNAFNGRRTGRDERLIHGVYMVTTLGQSLKATAQDLNVPYYSLQEAVVQRKMEDRLRGVGVDPQKITKYTVIRLASVGSDKVLKQAAALAQTAKMQVEMVNHMVTSLKRTRTEDEAIKWLGDFADTTDVKRRIVDVKRGKAHGSGVRRALSSTMLGYMSSVVTLSKKDTPLRAGFVTEELVRELEESWKALSTQMSYYTTRARMELESARGKVGVGDGTPTTA